MHQPPFLKINEIFPSIQGEGLRSGEPTLFLRLSGCNLKCSFCDTSYAWEKGEEMSLARVIEKLRKLHTAYPADWVCLTGGEPLMQDIGGLLQALKTEGFKIQVETNGTMSPPAGVTWFTVSPKPPDYFYRPVYKEKAKEVKIVVIEELDLNDIKKLRQGFPEKTPLLLQPRSNSQAMGKHARKLLELALKQGMKNIRLTAQIHKLFGWR